MADGKPRRSGLAELATVGGFTLAIFLVALCGNLIVSQFDNPSPWLFAASYAVPSGLAFAIYWFIARRL